MVPASLPCFRRREDFNKRRERRWIQGPRAIAAQRGFRGFQGYLNHSDPNTLFRGVRSFIII
jgi:hypothetical protein